MNRTVFITGASSGFGLLTANELHRKGYKVYGTSREPEKHHTEFELLMMDVRNSKSIDKAIDKILTNSGGIDVLINNAGVVQYGALEEASEADIQQIFDVNVFGVMRVTNAVLPHMRQRRSGRIINVTSLAGIIETPTFGLYCATKHAVEGYTKSLMYEVEPFNIEVALVKPGEYKTEIFRNALYSQNLIEDYKPLRMIMQRQIENRINGEVDDPSEVGRFIADIADSKSPKLHNRIGKFSGLIPFLNLFPNLVKKIVKKENHLNEIEKK